MAGMKSLDSVALECLKCSRQVSLDAAVFNSRLDQPLSINSVGQLHGRLRCSQCGSREVLIKDETGRVLVDPAAIVLCHECGNPIPLPRLEAMPGTSICVSCANEGAKAPPAPHYPQPPADKQKCPRCGSPTIVRQNNEDLGFFLGCTGFPNCRWTADFNQSQPKP
jgi:ssDNA-binding Zn-finger/Zn-ribbon topoisomerase 1